jgi:hypothetical protein
MGYEMRVMQTEDRPVLLESGVVGKLDLRQEVLSSVLASRLLCVGRLIKRRIEEVQSNREWKWVGRDDESGS